jgi:hypothetical protein
MPILLKEYIIKHNFTPKVKQKARFVGGPGRGDFIDSATAIN